MGHDKYLYYLIWFILYFDGYDNHQWLILELDHPFYWDILEFCHLFYCSHVNLVGIQSVAYSVL